MPWLRNPPNAKMSLRTLKVLSRGPEMDAATLYGSKYFGTASQRLQEKKLNTFLDNYSKRVNREQAIKKYQKMLGRGK